MRSGTPCSSLGELPAARAHLEQGIALYDPSSTAALAFRYGQDPGVLLPSLMPR